MPSTAKCRHARTGTPRRVKAFAHTTLCHRIGALAAAPARKQHMPAGRYPATRPGEEVAGGGSRGRTTVSSPVMLSGDARIAAAAEIGSCFTKQETIRPRGARTVSAARNVGNGTRPKSPLLSAMSGATDLLSTTKPVPV